MPGVKRLHQESDNSGKAPYIYGHHHGVIGILAGWAKKIGLHPFPCTLHVLSGQYPFQQVTIRVGRFNNAPHIHSFVRILCIFRKFANSLSLMVKAWMERAEKSANSQYARNWLQYRWSIMPPPCRAIAFQRRRTVNHAPSLNTH